MEKHSYMANEFGISLVYENETILVAYDYGFLYWRLVIVSTDWTQRPEVISLKENIDPFVLLKKIKR